MGFLLVAEPDAAWFGPRLRELREAADLTRKELAETAGLSTDALLKLEKGLRQPSWGTVLALAAALEVSTEEFTKPPQGQPEDQPEE